MRSLSFPAHHCFPLNYAILDPFTRVHKLPLYVLATGPYLSSLAFYVKMAFLAQSFPFTTLKTWFGTNIYLLMFEEELEACLKRKTTFTTSVSSVQSLSRVDSL